MSDGEPSAAAGSSSSPPPPVGFCRPEPSKRASKIDGLDRLRASDWAENNIDGPNRQRTTRNSMRASFQKTPNWERIQTSAACTIVNRPLLGQSQIQYLYSTRRLWTELFGVRTAGYYQKRQDV